MEGGAPLIGKQELLDRLTRGEEAGIAVVTPNQRLALALSREVGDRHLERGAQVWETPEVVPFGAFVERLWAEALHSERGANIPALLSDAQEQALWEACIRAGRRDSEQLMSVAFAAAQSREAWKLVHAWALRSRLDGAANHEDAKIFLAWAAGYEKECTTRRSTDAARLPDVVRPLLGQKHLPLPAAVVAYGFDIVTPQQRAFLDALAKAGVAVLQGGPDRHRSQRARISFPSSRDEIAACARWARARLEAGGRRIGIVVPDLARSRTALARALAEVLVPGNALPGAPARAMPFEISLAPPLDGYPAVRHALEILRLFGSDLEFEALSRIVRSPFIAGAETERSERVRLDVELRKRGSAVMTLEALRTLVAEVGGRAPILGSRLVRLAKLRNAAALGRRAPSAWAQTFIEALDQAGFPGERALDSAEYQAVSRFHELIGELATLDRVVKLMSFREAWQRLVDMARATLFQPKGSQAPVQVLGILESAGLEFEHLWVLGLTDEAWPLAERAHPFVSLRLQREAGVPQADPDKSLEIDRRLTEEWLAAAPEVIVSHARAEADRELFPSPLIARVPAAELAALALPRYQTLAAALRDSGRIERVDDRRAPPPAPGLQPHGTRLFKDQAACPFRGFAHHRMNAAKLEAPSPGVDARERGILLHTALAIVWDALKDKAGLDALAIADRDALLARAAAQAIANVRERRPDALGGRFGEIEARRLASHLAQWLAFESRRPDFAVVASERKQRLCFGGVEVEARLDRMDRLAAGGHAVIDYKTGEANAADWLGPRPEEPQLPMYALGSAEDVRAVVFARVKAGEFCFAGIAAADDLLPNVRTIDKNRTKLAQRLRHKDWDALVAAWREALEAIGRGYAQGDASVDPKDGALTCRQCDQQTFCRVSERLAVSATDTEADE